MPLDLIGTGIVFVVIMTAVIYFGKSVAVSSIFSIPIGAFLYYNFPYKDKLVGMVNSGSQSIWLNAAILLFFVVFSYIVVRRAVSVVFPWNSPVKFFQTIILSIIITGLLAMVLTNFINTDLVTIYFPILKKLLILPNITFWWLIGSILILFFILN